MPKPQPTIQRLRELLSYDKLTGVVVWKVGRVGRGCAAGAKVGGPDGKGYLRVCIDGHETGLHRAIWALVTGEWPVLDIDHEDGIGTNNAWKNLRHVTHQVNAENKRQPTSQNSLGVQGVRLRRGRYYASITTSGKQKSLGGHDTPEEAHNAYVTAKRALHTGCTI